MLWHASTLHEQDGPNRELSYDEMRRSRPRCNSGHADPNNKSSNLAGGLALQLQNAGVGDTILPISPLNQVPQKCFYAVS